MGAHDVKHIVFQFYGFEMMRIILVSYFKFTALFSFVTIGLAS